MPDTKCHVTISDLGDSPYDSAGVAVSAAIAGLLTGAYTIDSIVIHAHKE